MTGFEGLDDAKHDDTPICPKYASEATKKLKDGDYEVEVTAGILKQDEHGPRFTLLMVVLGPTHTGWKIEKTTFFNKKSGTPEEKEAHMVSKRNEVVSDCQVMGFDSENWKASLGRPFSAQVQIAGEVMKGVRLKVRKKQNGEFANLYINKRLAEADGKPAAFGAEQMVSPAQGFDAGHVPEGAAPVAGAAAPVSPGQVPW